jgi:hypothetical protein
VYMGMFPDWSSGVNLVWFGKARMIRNAYFVSQFSQSNTLIH